VPAAALRRIRSAKSVDIKAMAYAIDPCSLAAIPPMLEISLVN